MTDVSKKLKQHSHETDVSCDCARHKCFEQVNEEDQKNIKHFNEPKTHDEQILYLGILISQCPVKHHRSRKNDDEDIDYHSFSYTFKIRVQRNSNYVGVPLC